MRYVLGEQKEEFPIPHDLRSPQAFKNKEKANDQEISTFSTFLFFCFCDHLYFGTCTRIKGGIDIRNYQLENY